MLKAIIFDCDGVIADTEPIHMAGFARVLAESSITLSEEDYFDHYLALDDRGCFTKALTANGGSITQEQLQEAINRKAGYVESAMRTELRILPGVAEFIQTAYKLYPLAVASGALRAEIEMVLKFGGLRDRFQVIVSAEDVANCKPNPEPFLKARQLLDAVTGNHVEPAECLVIEDSINGIRAAHQAGMRCLAVTNSYPREKLTEADHIVDSLVGLSSSDVEALFDT